MSIKRPQIINCPACGYTFKPELEKTKITCPMCDYEFRLDDQNSHKDDFNRRIV